MKKIYVCSSWKNPYYETTIDCLREHSLFVWDWKNPPSGAGGFSWGDAFITDTEIRAGDMLAGLSHRRAWEGFLLDKHGIDQADKVILLLPSGRSAHLEAGYAVGAGKPLCIYMPELEGPDLMYKFAEDIIDNIEDVCQWCLS